MIELLRKIKEMTGPAADAKWSLSQHDILPRLVNGHHTATEAEGIARFLRHFLTKDDIFGCGAYIRERIREMLDGAMSAAEYLKWMCEAVSDYAGQTASMWTKDRWDNYVLFFDESSSCVISAEEAEIQAVPETDISGTLSECLEDIIRRLGGTV